MIPLQATPPSPEDVDAIFDLIDTRRPVIGYILTVVAAGSGLVWINLALTWVYLKAMIGLLQSIREDERNARR